MGRFGNSTEKHYLQLTDEEEDLLKAIKASGKFAHTIVVVNMANPFELGFLEDEAYGVDACLWYAVPARMVSSPWQTSLRARSVPPAVWWTPTLTAHCLLLPCRISVISAM